MCCKLEDSTQQSLFWSGMFCQVFLFPSYCTVQYCNSITTTTTVVRLPSLLRPPDRHNISRLSPIGKRPLSLSHTSRKKEKNGNARKGTLYLPITNERLLYFLKTFRR